VGFIEALTNMGVYWLDHEKPEQALTVFQKALEEDLQREDLHRKVMQIYAHLGRRSEAAAQYKRLSEYFENNNMHVSPETQTLYQEIMA